MPGTLDAYEEWGMDKDLYPEYPYIGWAADHFHRKGEMPSATGIIP